MREKILSIVVCTFLLLNFVHVEARSKTLKIGSMSPLTGPYATDGKDIRRGVETAIKVIEDEGGLPGFDKIEFFPQDTACDPRQAVSAAIELMDIEVNGVIGAYCSSSTVPASKVLNEGGIIMITPASTNPIVTDDGPDNMFRVSNRDDYTVKTAGNFLKNVLKAKKILIIDDGHEYSKEVSLEFEKYSKNNNIRILGIKHVNYYSSFSSPGAQRQADAIFIYGYSEDYINRMIYKIKRSASLKSDTKIITIGDPFSSKFKSLAKAYSEGIYVVSPYINQNTPAYKKFEEYYTMRFEKPGFYSAHAYDATMSLLMAIKKSGSTDPSKIKEELRKLNYQGASKRINFNDNGDTGSNYTVFGIHSGEFHPYLFGKAPYKCACDVSDECDAECSCDCDCPDNCE